MLVYHTVTDQPSSKLADFTVLSDDIFTGTSEKILKTKVLLTVMGGAVTYCKGM